MKKKAIYICLIVLGIVFMGIGGSSLSDVKGTEYSVIGFSLFILGFGIMVYNIVKHYRNRKGQLFLKK